MNRFIMKKFVALLILLEAFCCRSESFGMRRASSAQANVIKQQLATIPNYKQARAAYRMMSRIWDKQEAKGKIAAIAMGIKNLQSLGERLIGSDFGMSQQQAVDCLHVFLMRVRHVDLGRIQMADIRTHDNTLEGRNFYNLVRAMKILCNGGSLTFQRDDEFRAFDRLARVFSGKDTSCFPQVLATGMRDFEGTQNLFRFINIVEVLPVRL